jgi:hypothetical protein
MSTDRSLSLHVPRYAIWAVGILLVAPWLVVGALFLRPARETATSARISPATVQTAPTGSSPTDVVLHPGPWGEISGFRIMIEPPEEFILSNYTSSSLQPWMFKGYTEEKLTALLRSAGLTNAQFATLANAAKHEIKPGAIVVRPDAALIRDLSPAARSVLYAALGEFPDNFSQYNPYRLRTSLAASWFDNAELPEDAVALTKKLLYQRGTATCFSDEDIVLPLIEDRSDRVKYLKALSRKSALMVFLHVKPGQDVEALANYWGRGGRSKDLRPLLQSIARRPEGGMVDILHLVPRFARLLAYTYPLPSEKPSDANHDCHWTSFNFQNDTPDERFSDINYVRQVLSEQYYPVPGDPMLGDLIMFVRADGVVVHSCVFIADDVVFTKNGPAFSIPWLLSSLADVQAFYAAIPGVEMRRFRARNL